MDQGRYVRSTYARPKRAGGRLTLYTPADQGVHVLNVTAELLYDYLAEPAAFEEIVKMLEVATDAPSEAIRADLPSTLEHLVSLGVLERTG